MIAEVVDHSLTRRAVDGDVDAFSELVASHDDRMRAVAFRMLGDRAAMDDALQAAYLKAFSAISGFRSEANFGTWLHRIVVNSCYDTLRRSGRRAEVPLQVLTEVEEPGSWEDGLLLGQQLDQALQELPEDQRMTVILVDGQGLSYGEAAEVLEVERGTVASRLNRARASLRGLLGLEGS